MQIWRGLLSGETYSFAGKHLSVVDGKLLFRPVQRPHPPLYFGGSSRTAREIAAEQVDVYLTWGEPPAAVAEKIADVRSRAAKLGRRVRFGIRLRTKLEVSPNLWAGVGLVRGGAGTALVGDPATVAERLREYAALGIDTIVGSGYPHLEEAYRVAELLFPHLALSTAERIPSAPKGTFGGGGSMGVEAFPLPARATRG